MKDAFLALFIFFLLYPLHVSAGADENTKLPGDEQREIEAEVTVERVHAEIAPDLSIVIPSGRIQQVFSEQIGNIKVRSLLRYEIFTNKIQGSIWFSRKFWRLRGILAFYDGVEFENFFKSELTDGEIQIVPTDEYIERHQGLESGILFPLGKPYQSRQTFIVDNTFKGDLNKSLIIEEGIDLIVRSQFSYNKIKTKESEKGSDPHGYYVSSKVDFEFRDTFANPALIEHRNNYLHYIRLPKNIDMKLNVDITYPIYVWDMVQANLYRLGGTDSIRGYDTDSLHVFRFFLFTSDIKKEIPGIYWDLPEILSIDLSITRLKILLLVDNLFSQEAIPLSSPPKNRISIGTGIELTFVEEEKRHYSLFLSASQAIQRNRIPVFSVMFSTSGFKFKESLAIQD